MPFMDDSVLADLRERFFAALDDRRLTECQQMLDAARAQPWPPEQRGWLDYYQAIICADSAPPRWDEAERWLTPLLDAATRPDLRARALLEMGLNADMQGDCPRAVDYDERSLALFERLADHEYQAKILKNLGIACTHGYELGQFDRDVLAQALAYHQRSLQLCQAHGYRRLAATVRLELGTVHKALGEWAPALAHYRARAAVCRRHGERRSLGLALNNLGEIYQRQGRPRQAARCYRKAQALLQEAGDLYESADVTANLASLRRAQGRPAEALALYDQASAAVESIRAAQAAETARVDFFASEAHIYDARLTLCLEMKRTADAFATLERAKSRAFVDLLAQRSVRPPSQAPTDWLAEERELRDQLDALYHQEAAASAATEPAISDLEARLDALRRKISLHSPEYASFQTVQTLDLEAVQARLPADALLLEYFVTESASGVFLVSRAHAEVVALHITPAMLRRAFAPNRPEVDGLTPDKRGRLHEPWLLAELYRLLIAPVADRLAGCRTLCIIPHGPLHYVPFHALYTEEDGRPRYLVEDAALLYAPSATVLLDYCQRKPASAQTGALVLAYGGAPDAGVTGRSPFLRHALAEGRSVAAALGDGSALHCGADAQRARIFQEAGRYRFLHFACHGRFDPRYPLASRLELADGVLDAADILQRVQLDADLVALGSCETGLSALRRGDELIGLTRAFMYAGTPAVLVSLWRVDDHSTRILMERFYRELTAQGGATKAEALRRAQLALMRLTRGELRSQLARDGEAAEGGSVLQPMDEHPYAHPYYWAGFCLIGDRL